MRNPRPGFMKPKFGFLAEPSSSRIREPSYWVRETSKEPWILLLLLDRTLGSSIAGSIWRWNLESVLMGDDFELVEEYFDNSLLNLDVYNALEKCLQWPPGFVMNPGRTHPACAWVLDVDENPGPLGFVVNSGRTHPGRAGSSGTQARAGLVLGS
ncbi:hypothetical protein SLEP1_g18790 [Rubroshorea leprosula]|uniref:Uncharacterized protein n=1 Tax=Rubroshorea leprosula TaxID=152421 RepID=A0AAV5J7U7_9ROSI|nr:hypothetical protein SLEP1_g18790 [Rubroshorea leprosula]